MLRSIYSLVGFTIWATDGEIGKVKNFYFDDESWKIRYLIVKTGGWLSGRKVLLSPIALKTPFWDAESFPVNLSREQVKNSPDIDTDKPVSRQQEQDLHTHYSWANGGNPSGDKMSGGEQRDDEFPIKEITLASQNDPHLRSFKEVVGYKVFASENNVGRVDDFLVDKNWNIPYMVIETGKWHSAKRILNKTGFVQQIVWKNSSVFVEESLESLRNSREYDYTQLTNHKFERNLNTTR